MRLLSGTTKQLTVAGLQDEADSLALEMPLLEPDAYGANAANRKRLHFESHNFNWLSFVGDRRRTFRDERGMLIRDQAAIKDSKDRVLGRFA